MENYSHTQVVDLFDEEGLSLGEIALVVGCSESRASQILKEHGRSPWERRYPFAYGWDWDCIFADYKDGMPLEKLLEKHQVSSTTFHRRRKAAGIPSRPRRGAKGKRNYQYKHGNSGRSHPYDRYLSAQVAAACLGHVVPKAWQIHHLDENPTNNRPENLAIFYDRSQHAQYHQKLLKLQREGLQADAIQLVLESGGFLLPIPTRPLVLPHEKDRLCPHESQP